MKVESLKVELLLDKVIKRNQAQASSLFLERLGIFLGEPLWVVFWQSFDLDKCVDDLLFSLNVFFLVQPVKVLIVHIIFLDYPSDNAEFFCKKSC